MSLEGQVAIVTGGAVGLGEAIAAQLASAGARIALFDIDPAAAGTAQSLSAGGRDARAYQVDVSDSSAVDTAVDAVARQFGRLDIMVNNAGVSLVGPPIQDTTDEAWHRTIAVMQTGVFYCMRAASRHMLAARRGSIVNISSIRGFSPNPGRIAYCAAKSAVIMMTKVAAGEWASYGVRVNAIAPGVQRTPMWEEDVRNGSCDEELILRVTPAGRLGRPAEVGALAAYLCSDAAEFITGACIAIDGGLTSVPIDGTITRPDHPAATAHR